MDLLQINGLLTGSKLRVIRIIRCVVLARDEARTDGNLRQYLMVDGIRISCVLARNEASSRGEYSLKSRSAIAMAGSWQGAFG